MRSLTKIMILSLSLGVFAQDTYAAGGNNSDDEYGCWKRFQSVFNWRKASVPVIENALEVAAAVTHRPEFLAAEGAIKFVDAAIDKAEEMAGINPKAATFKEGLSAEAKKEIEAAAGGVSGALKVMGQGDSGLEKELEKVVTELEKK